MQKSVLSHTECTKTDCWTPWGTPFIDQSVIDRSKQALKESGLELVENDLIVATKKEAREVILPLARDESVDCLVLFSGTWVWART